MIKHLLAHKCALFLLILAMVVGAVMLPYRAVFQIYSAFAPFSYQSTLVLDAGHGGCKLRMKNQGRIGQGGTEENEKE